MVRPSSAMRVRRLLPVVVVMLLLAPAAGAAQETQDTTRLPAAMRSARGAFQAAFRGLDANAAAPLFADSAVVDFGGQIVSGRVAIAESWLPQTVQGLASIRFGPSSYVISEGQVVENGSHFVVSVDAGGAEQPGTHRLTWRQQPDRTWKVTRLEVFGA